MDSDWGEVCLPDQLSLQETENFQLHRLQLPPVEGNTLQSGTVSTVAFDTHQELLWAGTECVRNSSATRDHASSI